jgi:hypothetical protein
MTYVQRNIGNERYMILMYMVLCVRGRRGPKGLRYLRARANEGGN